MSAIAFAFEIGGRSIDPTAITDPTDERLIQEIVESIVDRVGDVVCREHGQGPRFLCRGEHVGALTLEVEGCCDALLARVRERMA